MKAPLAGGQSIVVVGNLNDAHDVAVDDQNIYYVTAGTPENTGATARSRKSP